VRHTYTHWQYTISTIHELPIIFWIS